MKKLILMVFFAGLMACLAGCASLSPSSPAPAAAAMTTVLAGDSNTAYAPLSADVFKQLGARTAPGGTQTKGWQYKGSTMVYVRSLPHEGYPGRGVAYLTPRLLNVLKSLKGKKVVVLNIGANDMWVSLQQRVPISDKQALQVAAAWQSLADQCLARGAEVVAVLPATPSNAKRPLGILRSRIQAWAISRGAPLVDLAGCANDGVHFKPVSAGYGAVAQRYVTGIKQTRAWSSP